MVSDMERGGVKSKGGERDMGTKGQGKVKAGIKGEYGNGR